MKKIKLLVLLLLVALVTTAQSSLDSVALFRYDDGQTIPVYRTYYQNDLWGKVLNEVNTVFDDFENIWTDLSRDQLIYNGDQLIETITYSRQVGTWVPGWRNIYTYPEEGSVRKEFYTLSDGTENLQWVTVTNEGGETVSVTEVYNEETSTLVETFRSVRSDLTNGYNITNSRIGVNGNWKEYYSVDHIVNNGQVVEKLHRSQLENVWVNINRTVNIYNDRDQLERSDSYRWSGSNWITEASQSTFYYYSDVVINPPEIDEQNLINIYKIENSLFVNSKIELDLISVYDLETRLIYRNNSPSQTEIILTDIKGEFYIEILSVDKRKKISKVLFK